MRGANQKHIKDSHYGNSKGELVEVMGVVLEGGSGLGWGDRVVCNGTESKCGVQKSMERGAYSKRVREGKREEGWMREKNKKKDKERGEVREKEAEKGTLAAVY